MHPNHSVLHDSDIQSPPFSPRAPEPNKSTVLLLESLVSFYRQEMMWVYRTRAALDSELGSSANGIPDSTDDRSTTPSPTIAAQDDANVKAEPLTSPPLSPATRWRRRKQNFKLRLDGFPQSHRLRQVGESKSGVRVLELFESMMEARMESCERVHRLVKAANRANLYVR
jgi:hypothetical protein